MTTETPDKLITTCAVLHLAGRDPDNEGRQCMGHCPACHQAVWDTEDPVWTCPANLQDGNPHQKDPCAPITAELQEKHGVFSWCGTDFGYGCYEDMPLHGRCYGGETGLTW